MAAPRACHPTPVPGHQLRSRCTAIGAARLGVSALIVACLGLSFVDGAHGRTMPTAEPGQPSSAALRELPLAVALRAIPGTPRAHAVIESLVQQCMERKGFPYLPRALTPLEQDLTRRYGLVDLELARTYGYQHPDHLEGSGPPPGLEYVEAMSPQEKAAWDDAYLGTKTRGVDVEPGGRKELILKIGGCLPTAQQRVYGSLDRRAALSAGLQRLGAAAFAEAGAQRGVRRAKDGWVSCMRRAGYDYRSFEHARRSIDVDDVSMATADAECNLRTHLAERWNAAEIATQRRMLAAEPDLLQAWDEQLAREERRAGTISLEE